MFPFGDQEKWKVRASNQLTLNLLVLLCIAHFREVFFLAPGMKWKSLFLVPVFQMMSELSSMCFCRVIHRQLLDPSEAGATCIWPSLVVSGTDSALEADLTAESSQLDALFWPCFAKTISICGKHQHGDHATTIS